MSDLTSILEELAAGRIDAAEAARRIDAAKKSASAPQGSQADQTPTQKDDEPVTVIGGRPQFATHARESFRPVEEPRDEAGDEKTQESPDDPQVKPKVRTKTDDADLDDLEDVTATPSAKPAGSRGVTRVVIRGVGRRVRIIGDSSVATLSAEGPHVLRRSGATLEVTSDGDIGPSLDGFSLIRPPRSLDDFRTLGMGKELLIRINPAIVVDVEVTAGSLNCSKVPMLGKVRVTAGGATLTEVKEVSDALVQAGSATVRGPIQQGRSRVRVESGSLSVTLTEGANVTIKADAQLGRVSWPGETAGQTVDEYVVGNGSARLDVGVVMGHASIRVEGQEPTTGN